MFIQYAIDLSGGAEDVSTPPRAVIFGFQFCVDASQQRALRPPLSVCTPGYYAHSNTQARAMGSNGVLSMLSGGSMEMGDWSNERCDELCAAVRGAPAVSRSAMGFEGRNSDGYTAFLLACRIGHVEGMQLLADAGCNTAGSSNYGGNALMLASFSGVPAAVSTALAAGWCELEARGKNGYTAFLIACFKGCTACMQLLADAGCNTAATNNYHRNALMLASHSGVPAAVSTALAAGWGELEARDKNGYTAFLDACGKGCTACMQLLANAGCNTAVSDNCGSNALLLASHSGVPAAVSTALAAGWCELEARGKNGYTAFLIACAEGCVDSMQLLAGMGCNTAATNNYHRNALMLAAYSGVPAASQSGVPAAVSTALAAGWGELEARDENGYTTFLYTCIKGCTACMQLLADAGCNTAATNNYGSNALLLASQSGVPAAVSTALAAGWCELEAKDKYDYTAFLDACGKGCTACMQLLADAGCNTAAVTNRNETAADVAEGCGNAEAVQWLQLFARAAAHRHRAQELMSSGRLSEALAAAKKAVRLLPRSTTLARLSDEVQSAVASEFEQRERQARAAEAELMAILDGESAPTDRSVGQARKTQRKKEKRRRQQQAKREAAARRAQVVTEERPEEAPEPEPESAQEPELDHQLVPLSPAIQTPTSPYVDSESDAALKPARMPPDEFCCPITSECMRDPVIVTATGMTYEREAIAEWFSEHNTDPSTGVELGKNKQLVPNVITRKMIDARSRGCLGI
eukprot:COSAG02_NODE_2708_length_8189_cov_3.908282_6_plen_753_part_00